MDGKHLIDVSTVIEKALDMEATDSQLEESFAALDAHPQTYAIRQSLIDENKHVWWSMAINLSDTIHQDKETPVRITLKEMTPTAQFYRLRDHLRSLSTSIDGSPIGVLINNLRFCITNPQHIESLQFFDEYGSKLITAKQPYENRGMRTFQADRVMLHDENQEIMDAIVTIKNAKKMIVSPNGKWIYTTFYNSKPCLVFINDLNENKAQIWLSEKAKITSFAIDENNQYGLCLIPGKGAVVLKINGTNLDTEMIGETSDGICVDINTNGIWGLIASENSIKRIKATQLYETKSSPINSISTTRLTNVRLSPCGDYVFTTHSNGWVAVLNLESSNMVARIFPQEILSKIAINPTGDSLVFGGGSCLGRFTIASLLEKLKTTLPSHIATLIQVWGRKENVKKSAFLKEKFSQMSFPHRKNLLAFAKINLGELNLAECPICYYDIADSTTSCKHAFCCSCLEQRIKDNPTCPLCRTPLKASTP